MKASQTLGRAATTTMRAMPPPRAPKVPKIPEEHPERYFAVAAPGLETLVAAELSAIGVEPTAPESGGVEFSGGLQALCRAHLWLRTASRILVRLGEFHAGSFDELERHARRLPWERWLGRGEAVRFRVTCQRSRLYHSGAVAERLGEAAALRAGAVVRQGSEVADDEAGDGQLVVVRLVENRCTVSADASGALLHRRGYRLATAKAPLRETLAAALVLGAGWDGKTPLIDPLCGSGTIAIEAALLARRLAPGRRRHFRFMEWPDFDASLWPALCAEADEQALPAAPAPILACDRDPGAIRAAEDNAQRAGVGGDVACRVQPLVALVPPAGPTARGLVATNPPYGERIGTRASLRRFYMEMDTALRRACAGWALALIAPERAASLLRMPLTPVVHTKNGGIPVQILVGQVPGG
jgi:putative N6-adenine-specific DNA methylase